MHSPVCQFICAEMFHRRYLVTRELELQRRTGYEFSLNRNQVPPAQSPPAQSPPPPLLHPVSEHQPPPPSSEHQPTASVRTAAGHVSKHGYTGQSPNCGRRGLSTDSGSWHHDREHG
ncbi:hypothetical protein NQZ68_038905 [Dissostichus eleginoides]|nr:hypothetical protein NQZ68_038905 [Dissostichus eleginoides]